MNYMEIDKETNDIISSSSVTVKKIKTKKIVTKKQIKQIESIELNSSSFEEIIDENNLINNNNIDLIEKSSNNNIKKKSSKKLQITKNNKNELIKINNNNNNNNNDKIVINENLIINNENDNNLIKSELIVQQNIVETQKNVGTTEKLKENKVSIKKQMKKLKCGKDINSVNSTGIQEKELKCKSCNKTVYKMEEIKAENSVWHKTCFKCHECSKPLSIDTYQSHESILYCKAHLKLLFAPKTAFENENDEENLDKKKKRKPELIIRENQPMELSPDIVRSSDTPNLGLEELQQLNVRARFQVFENFQEKKAQQEQNVNLENHTVKRKTSILSKMAKFNGKGLNDENINGSSLLDDSDNDENFDPLIDSEVNKIYEKREHPIRFDQMNDIKTKFENGTLMSKEERREERKQEIQNIRSRLFMGKQARIKEQYQQAVAESEQGITSTGKKCEIDIGDKAKSLKEKFEKGELFRDQTDNNNNQRIIDDEEIFEAGIGKQSRSLFLQLDASTSKLPIEQHLLSTPLTRDNTSTNLNNNKKFTNLTNQQIINSETENNLNDDLMKIETSQISSNFKFFENYNPNEKCIKKIFRITPPRDGIDKIIENNEINNKNLNDSNLELEDETVKILTEQHTATKMLSRFRELEQNEKFKQNNNNNCLKPLKQFTPPPEGNKRIYTNDSDSDNDEQSLDELDDSNDDDDNSDNGIPIQKYDDESLKIAQQAARAKKLCAKFEKWESNQIQNEQSYPCVEIYDNSTEESQIESAKSLRAKFESMKNSSNNTRSQPRVQVNRFV